jgi:GAF domain-containing protein
MAEELIIASGADKKSRYETLIPQIKALTEDESDLIANLANVCAALKQTFDFFWVGFYLVKHEQLVLGPFQGPLACTRIDYGKGVCGTTWKEGKTIIVPDVEQYPGHIACSSASKSEIVVPGFSDDKVFLVLDVDSDKLEDFDGVDAWGLEQIVACIEKTVARKTSVA